MATNNGKFAPEHKNPGDLILSDDWNAGMQEAVRLESDKVNRKGGDSLEGPLTIESALAVETNAIASVQLEVKGALKLAEGVAVNQFSSDDSLSANTDSIVPTQKAVKTYVDTAVQGRETQDFKAKDLRIYGTLTVEGNVISKDTQKMEGNVELGNEDGDIITIFGTIRSGHSTNRLVVNNPIVATAFIGEGAVVAGMILMWSGQSDRIPTGWALCNGQNGTPDLRDRFIVAAGNKYAISNTGGEEFHRLTINEMPNHNHYESPYGYLLKIDGRATAGSTDDDNYWREPNLYSCGSIMPTGGDQPHENRPPYYALAFIMKL
ncbi:hypothetical protein [Kamptonema sp. UHCC 0994]|uniref:hypothetical protein n=1 Tax=Kamptonema sp. UHCC 0994 TaxID=3031329 RepID=UPI0023B8A6C6|nr:hypothetical protein [Kamptonema sp. UHCC 0994]MDF0551818.1 hypothetical protein [Kamptonema sp. UHCC 0994]